MTLTCFNHDKKSKTIPIQALNQTQLNTWLPTQDVRIKNILNAFNFTAAFGQYALICDQKGQLEQVIAGIGNENNLGVFGQLAQKLPEGIYHLDSQLSDEDKYHSYLAWGLGSYQFTPYKKPKIFSAKLHLPKNENEADYLNAVLKATYLVRDLINTPAEDMMPADLAEAASKLVDEFGGKIKMLVGDDLLKAGYAAIHAVGRASQHLPHLIDMRWGNKKHPKVTLVGKGVCFDSGGLDIKPASGMLTMKKDMGGAAHVLGLTYIIMSLNLPIQLRVLIPAVENAVSGNAFHPGDIIRTRKGISVEVNNTDAEGRLILCDALDEGAREQPDLLLNIATLTGAARVALGTEIGALFSRHNELAQKIIEAGEREKDPIWQMPLYPGYRKLLNSNIADISNAASGGYGGAITAALFLKEFVPDEIVWGHFDVMAWNTENKPTGPEGGEALSLRAIARYLLEQFGR